MTLLTKITLIFCGLFLSCINSFSNTLSESELLRMLDDAVTQRDKFVKEKEDKINSLRTLYARAHPATRYDIAEDLFYEYWGYDTDSARYYSNCCHEYAAYAQVDVEAKLQCADIYMARCLAVNGLYEESKQILNPIEKELYPQNRLSYWTARCELNVWEAALSDINKFESNFVLSARACRDSILACDNLDPSRRIYETSLNYSANDLQEKKTLLINTTDTISISNPYLRYLANDLAGIYKMQNMPDSARYFYALSAYSDLRQCVREHVSLRDLAVLLYEQGDVVRAYDYITLCMEDAEASGARLRSIELNKELPVIVNAYHKQVCQQRNRLTIGVLVLAILVALVVFELWRLYRIRRRLKEVNRRLRHYQDDLKQSKREVEKALQQMNKLNEELTESNLSLEESNRIKQTYVTQYMKQCSSNIAKIENYRMHIQKVAMTSNYAKLVSTIKETEIIENELEEFYRGFDETFLGLFPTFIDDFNALLRPEEQQPKPSDNRLTTELRIFALIRLGINDSEEIADFLRYSVKTIYNYRTRMRNKAIGSRKELEAEVMNIGSANS